jgi:hypothetical protein
MIREAINEIGDTPKGQYALGAVSGRATANLHNIYGDIKNDGYDYTDDMGAQANKYLKTSCDALGKAMDGCKDNDSEMRQEYQRGYGDTFNKYSTYDDDYNVIFENNLNRIVKESVNRILNESYREFEPRMVQVYPTILEADEAFEIGEEEGLDEKAAAKMYFEQIVKSDEEFVNATMPKYNRFICHIDYIDADLYYDFGVRYYFCVKEI